MSDIGDPPDLTPDLTPDLRTEARLVGLHAAHYVELVQLAAVFVEDLALCEEVVQDAFVKLPLLGLAPDTHVAALRQIVLTLSRSATADVGGIVDGSHAILRSLDRDPADLIALHHCLGLDLPTAASTLGLDDRTARSTLQRGVAELERRSVAPRGRRR